MAQARKEHFAAICTGKANLTKPQRSVTSKMNYRI
jgi:hypothetical protein